MHFSGLLVMELPEIEHDREYENDMIERLKMLHSMRESRDGVDGAMLDFIIEQNVCISNKFGLEIYRRSHQIMEAYWVETEERRYLTFCDKTEEYKQSFEELVDCIKLPDGAFVELSAPIVCSRFMIKDGKVFQTKAGPLNHPKRSKAAKRMEAVQGCHKRRIYGDFESFVYEACFGVKNEENGRYGEWYNPNGCFDWYQIGGRWPAVFLVSDDCKDYCIGERRSNFINPCPTPEGCKWVSAARKKNIKWDEMKQCMDLSSDGWDYAVRVNSIFSEEDVMHKESWGNGAEIQSDIGHTWSEIVEKFIDSLDEETVLVGIDYHC